MTSQETRIIYTKIDEAPALATYSLLPILQSYTRGTGISFEPWDISLAGRILATFPEYLQREQKVEDYLQKLGELVKKPEANIVKLPNISASLPQLKAAIGELRSKGYMVPEYVDEVKDEEQASIRRRYAQVLGSAVNPVLREGNSDRRAAASVKEFARNHPHSMMKAWPEGSKTRVAHMEDNDFYASEKTYCLDRETTARIEFAGTDGTSVVLKEKTPLLQGEVIDAAVMNVKALCGFFKEQMDTAKEEDILLSLHLKATMMKVSDPIIFGHCVSVYCWDALAKHQELLQGLGVNLKNGLSDLYAKIETLPEAKRLEIEADIAMVSDRRPRLAMVDSRKGITNLHLPNNVIIDASMPVVIRDGGRMWGSDDQLHDTLAMIPDSSYAMVYQEVIEDCQRHGAFDPASMGSVANVGLMAQKAEEYGSHDKTFESPGAGEIRVVDADGHVLLSQQVGRDDIFRMCQTKEAAITDWVKLAVDRARVSQEPAVFWLDENRAHDRQLAAKVANCLSDHDTEGIDIRILSPVEAMRFTLARVRQGRNTIAVTGNVLRDYLTDLFPILELGTSAKMLSIVPLMNGGGLFETGAGGSAPKHVQQFLEEGHLRWDSLGEFCALTASFEHLARSSGNSRAAILAETLDEAVGRHLEEGRAPSRKVGELDNRGSHFYLALYWAEALAAQDKDEHLQMQFSPVATELATKEGEILKELNGAQGRPVDIGGYYYPDDTLVSRAMRPSATLNTLLERIGK